MRRAGQAWQWAPTVSRPRQQECVTWFGVLSVVSMVISLASTNMPHHNRFPVAVFLPVTCTGDMESLVLNRTVELAATRAQKALMGHSVDLTLQLFDSCYEAQVMKDVVSVASEETDFKALIGPASDALCEPSAWLASSVSLPMVAWNCVGQDLQRPGIFSSFARTVTHGGAASSALAAMLKHFLWEHVVLLHTNNHPWFTIVRDIHFGLAKDGFRVTEMVPLLPGFTELEIIDQMAKIDKSMKAIVVMMDMEDKGTFLHGAYRAGLTGGDHAIFLVEFQASVDLTSYLQTLGMAANVSQALEAIFVFTAQPMPYVKPFSQDKEHLGLATDDSINSTSVNHNSTSSSERINENLFNAIQLLATAIQRVITSSTDADSLLSGPSVSSALRNISFQGASGLPLRVDPSGELFVYFTLMDYYPELNSFKAVLEVPKSSLQLARGSSIRWPNNRVLPPDLCAFQECPEGGFDAAILGIVIVVVIVLAGLGAAATYFIRKRLAIKEMEKGPNKILLTAEDLVFVSPKSISKSSKSFKSQSMFDKPDILKTSQKSLSNNSFQEFTNFSELARYKGDLVYVKEIKVKGFEMKSKVLGFLKQLRDMRHENVNSLMGFFVDPTKASFVWEYCSRKSLEDIIHNDTIKLDWDFKLSLLTDLVRGLKYIHNSPIRSHGNLKSGNCVIDSRWVLKLTDYGLGGMLERYQTHRDQKAKELLWTAPELLRDEEMRRHGSPKGDVYSFSIVLQEVILRGAPFCMLELDPEDIIKKVRKPPPMCRPSVSQQAAPPQYIQIMKQCWAEMPDMRPDFDQIHQQFKDITKGKKMNIVDTMFKMLEKYSNDLEDIVRDRTMELEEEKKKTENLLSQMLPPSVAQSLLTGKPVEAETFQEVTIYFSDIVGFTTISAMSTPMQVVALLNDLYTMFDSTIDDYDVYKVETIGDAYMVVSGLPDLNGNRHAGEVATMALDLLSQCGQFTISHMPDIPLRLRIGLHTGPCVAGVVGLRMPRYCLFGDTVNTASRMESTGAAFRVHVSGLTKAVLDELGGYHLDFRGEVELKGKGIHKTYWLMSKDGFTKPLPEPPPLAGLASLGVEGSDKNDKEESGGGKDCGDNPGNSDEPSPEEDSREQQASTASTAVSESLETRAQSVESLQEDQLPSTEPGEARKQVSPKTKSTSEATVGSGVGTISSSSQAPNNDFFSSEDQVNNNNNTNHVLDCGVADISQVQPRVDANQNWPQRPGVSATEPLPSSLPPVE